MRSTILRRLAFLALVPAALLGLLVVASPAQAAVTPFLTLQNDINYWTNHQRALHGCGALRAAPRLGRAGRDHSAWMARTNTFSHVGSAGSSFVTRTSRAGYTA